jgi:hypothetical protein
VAVAALFLSSTPTPSPQVAGGPLAALLLSVDGAFGLAGWQILFLVESVPTVAAALWAFNSLPRSPATAACLSPDARRWLTARQRAGARAVAARAGSGSASAASVPGVFAALGMWRIWALGFLDALVSVAKYSLLFFAPLLVDAILGSASPATVAALTAFPFTLAAAATVVNAAHSRRVGERRWHVVWPIAACAVGLVGLAFALPCSAPAALLSLALGLQVYAATGVVASYPAGLLGGEAAVVGYALANAVSNVGGAVGPAAFGAISAATGGYGPACGVAAAVAAVAAGAYAAVLPLLAPDPPPGGGGKAAPAPGSP